MMTPSLFDIFFGFILPTLMLGVLLIFLGSGSRITRHKIGNIITPYFIVWFLLLNYLCFHMFRGEVTNLWYVNMILGLIVSFVLEVLGTILSLMVFCLLLVLLPKSFLFKYHRWFDDRFSKPRQILVGFFADYDFWFFDFLIRIYKYIIYKVSSNFLILYRSISKTTA